MGSVATASMTPSRSPWISASRSRSPRKGGLTLSNAWIGKLGGRKPHRQVMRRDLGGDREADQCGPAERFTEAALEDGRCRRPRPASRQRLERGAHGGGLAASGRSGARVSATPAWLPAAITASSRGARAPPARHQRRGASRRKHRHRRGVAPVVAEGDGTGRRTGADVDQLLAAETAAGRRRHEDLDRRPGRLERPPQARSGSLSAGGSVLAMATICVKPPAAPALAPVCTVSAASSPGSRRWVCRSVEPGARMHGDFPGAGVRSTTGTVPSSIRRYIAMIRPSLSQTS